MTVSTTWSIRYPWNKENVNRYTPERGGVYRLIYESSGKYYVFYVGQSNNLRRRLIEHLSPFEPDACIRRHLQQHTCYFRFIIIESEFERRMEEGTEIREYNPSCNS